MSEEKAKAHVSLCSLWARPGSEAKLSLRFALKFLVNIILILSQLVITKKMSDLIKSSAVYLNPYNIIPSSYLASAQLSSFFYFQKDGKRYSLY